MSGRVRLVAAVVSGALAVGGCAGASLALAQRASAALPVVGDDLGPGDGLDRFVLTLRPDGVAAAPAPAASALAAPSAPAAVSATAAERATAALGAGGHEVQVGETTYYVTARGAVPLTPGASGDVLSLLDLAQWASQRGVAVDLPVAGGGAPPAPLAPSSVPAPTTTSSPAATDAQLAAIGAAPGVVSVQRIGDGRVLVAGDLRQAQAVALPGVAGAERSPEASFASTTISDPLHAANGWALENTGYNAPGQTAVRGSDVAAIPGWDASQGEGTVVAVVDAGFDTDHPDLTAALWSNPAQACGTADTDGNGLAGDCHGWNWMTNSADVDNGSGGDHGTYVAGTVAAQLGNGLGGAGIAPRTKIMPLVCGSGGTVDVALCIQAIRYAVDHGADVVNASWGGPMAPYWVDQLHRAVAYAGAHGVLVVAAAGNDSKDRDTAPSYPASLTDDNLIVAGASTAADTTSSFSAYGATSVDLFAPGTRVLTTTVGGGYGLVNGTSFSSPLTAGAVAVYESARPDLSAAQVKALLLADTEEVPAFAGRSVTGGRLDLATLGATTGGARYTFSSLRAAAGAVAPQVAVESATGPGAYALSLGVVARVDGEAWAVAGTPLTLDGQVVTTGDDGFATFGLGSLTGFPSRTFSPGLQLAEGTYALVAQLVHDGHPVGRPYAAPLVVSAAAGSSPSQTPAPSTTTTSAPSATPTPTPTPSARTTSAPSATPTATPGAGTAPAPGPRTPTPSPTSTPRATTPPTPSTPGATGSATPRTPAGATPSPSRTSTAAVTPAPPSAPTPGPTGGGARPPRAARPPRRPLRHPLRRRARPARPSPRRPRRPPPGRRARPSPRAPPAAPRSSRRSVTTG